MENRKNINWAAAFKISGAFAAYQIGAGFASGQETMQYFGTFGGKYPYILPVFAFILIAAYCFISYRTGCLEQFKDPNEAYEHYCGKYFGKVLNIFTNLVIAMTVIVMFAGCGATIHQYLGLPVWVGSVVIGVLSAVVVLLGLEKVSNVLGFCGILIIAIMAFAGIYTITTADTGLMEAQQHVAEYVESGILLRVDVFGIENPFLTAFAFVGMGLALVMTFNVALGTSCKSKGDYWASAVISAVFFVTGVYTVLFTMLLNLDYIAETGAKVPMLAAIENAIPWLSLPYTIIVCTGIFTTIVGFLWTVGRRFAEDGTTRQRIIVVVLDVVGITVGSLIPLDRLVNLIFPIVGYAGMILFVCMVVKGVRGK